MMRVASLAAVSLLALALAGCATDGTNDVRLDRVKAPVSFPQTERDYDGGFSQRPAVQRVRVPGGLFVSRPAEGVAPNSVLAKRVEVDIRSDVPTLADLQTLLEIQGVSITLDQTSLEAGNSRSKVGSFTAASKYQGVANSVSGGTGIQQQGGFGGGLNRGLNGINGGLNGGLNNGGLNSGINGGINGGVGNGGFGGGGSGTNVNIKGSASEGSGSEGGSSDSQGLQAVSDADQRQQDALQRLPGGANADGSASTTGSAQSGGRQLPTFYDRALPFRSFKGTVGDLMRRLENTGNIAVWYDGNATDGGFVVGDVRRYSVAVMQNQDIVQSIVNELIRLGAKNVTGSVGAGQIFYSAGPRTNGEIIEPYLRRLQGNLSEVTLQIALVTVSMTRSAEAGFDWSALNFGYGTNVTNGGGATTTGTGTTGTTGTASTAPLGNGVFTLSANAFNANLGDIFGTGKIVSVASAIRYLSRIGSTSVAQNVELRTLSGSPVILRSGENIPYVQNVGATLGGGFGGGALGSSQTAQLGTGLTVNVDPRYDSSSGIVTMDVGMKLVDLVEFVQLNAGAQLGTLTQPRTREQGINSIVRLSAGQTAILGGIRRDLTSDARSGPFDAFAIGSRNRSREVFWLFAIVRPVVTVYETADAPIAPRSVLDTRTTVNPYDDGSYGQVGRPDDTSKVLDEGAKVGAPGAKTYYARPGAVTPANRVPGGVVVSSPSAPRNVVIPGSASSAEVSDVVPEGAIVRDPVTPASVSNAGRKRVLDAGSDAMLSPDAATAAARPSSGSTPRVDPGRLQSSETTMPASSEPAAPQPPVKQRRSFVRPMTDAEKIGGK